MSVVKLLERLIIFLKVPKYEIARKLGLSPSTTNNYISGAREPDPHVCLMLAGLCAPEDREAWVRESGLSDDQLRLIRKGLRIEAPTAEEMGEIADLLANPDKGSEEAVVNLVRVTVQNRIERRGAGR